MRRSHNARLKVYLILVIPAGLLAVYICSYGIHTAKGNIRPTTNRESPLTTDKMALWNSSSGPHLRGANIYQRRVYPELDGPDFMGPGPVGPPYTQEDFDRLAEMGANCVILSRPGLFTETPPYTLDKDIQDNLDNLIDMIAKADMFAVISFRTGPGRSEFTFHFDDVGEWFDESYLNDAVWQDQAAQDAWVAMWRYTAERYHNNPIVVGYNLMVEPNANHVWLDIWDPEEFHANYGGTLYDWNQLHPRITAAIREVDGDTPILIGGMGYSAVEWLPYIQLTGDPRTVYTAHQYKPISYTHQWWTSQNCTYPGMFDTNGDGIDDPFNRTWLENLLSTVDTFATTHGVPVAVDEFGVMRWEPGAADFMDDQMGIFEQQGVDHALWVWDPSWEPWTEEVDAFNFRHGPDPDNHADVASSDLIEVIVKYWERNIIRPSNVTFPITFLITFGEKTYSVTTLSDSNIENFNFNQTLKQISFNVTGPTGTTGFCNVSIPEDLLWGEFSVYKDGSPLVKDADYTQTHNGTHNIFCITYSHSTHLIEIKGTEAIPEFPSALILPLFIIITLVVVVLSKKKRHGIKTKFL